MTIAVDLGCKASKQTNQTVVDSFNFFHAGGNFCHLLTNFANSLDPDQDRQKKIPAASVIKKLFEIFSLNFRQM